MPTLPQYISIRKKHVIMLIVHVSTKNIRAKYNKLRQQQLNTVESPTTPTVRAQNVIVPNFYKH